MSAAQSLRALNNSWRIQRRVIGALLLREIITRYGRHNIGFLWLFIEPMMFTIGITVLWTAIKATHGSSIPITAFALTGYSSVLLWRNMPSRCIKAIEPNLSLMYHRNVKLLDIFIARLLLEGGGATISFITLSCVFIFVGWIDLPENVLLVMCGWFLLAWFGAALAILLGSLSEESEIVDKLWHPTSYFLFPLSGAGFTADAAPPELRDIVLILPMVHGVEMVRDGYFGSKLVAHYDVFYLILVCLGMTILAFAQARRISRKVIPE